MQLSQNGLLRQCRKVLRTRDYKLYSLAQSSTISRVNCGPESGDGQNIDPSTETTPMDQLKMNKSFWSIVFANHNTTKLGRLFLIIKVLPSENISKSCQFSQNRLMQIFAMFIHLLEILHRQPFLDSAIHVVYSNAACCITRHARRARSVRHDHELSNFSQSVYFETPVKVIPISHEKKRKVFIPVKKTFYRGIILFVLHNFGRGRNEITCSADPLAMGFLLSQDGGRVRESAGFFL